MVSDGEYDRLFITGVLSTGIYCLPSCRARKPKPENIRFFETIGEAQAAGLRACKKCRPDDFYQGVDLDLERIEAVVTQLQESPWDFAGIGDLCESAGIGNSKLFDSCRKHYHTTPGELIARSRVDASCRLLLESEASVSEIAFQVGFETLSTFYEHFGRLTGMPPLAYRKLPASNSFAIMLPQGFRQGAVLGYFGRDPLSLSERMSGNELLVSFDVEGEPGTIQLTFGSDQVECRVAGGTTLAGHRGVSRMLGIRQDPKSFEALALKLGRADLIEGRIGLRVPQTLALYDGIVWSILGQQVNLAFAYALRRRLTELVGVRLGDGLISPPTAEKVAKLSVDDLLPLQFSRRKAEYLIDSSRQIVAGHISLETLASGSATRAEKTLLEVRGLGPWSVHYMMMRAFGFADCLPVGDTGLTSGLQRSFELETRPDVAQTLELMAPFSPHRSLACLHLWQSLKFES